MPTRHHSALCNCLCACAFACYRKRSCTCMLRACIKFMLKVKRYIVAIRIFLYNSVFNNVCNYDTFIYFKRVETVIPIALCVKMAMCPVVWTQEHMSRQFYFTWLDVDNRS